MSSYRASCCRYFGTDIFVQPDTDDLLSVWPVKVSTLIGAMRFLVVTFFSCRN